MRTTRRLIVVSACALLSGSGCSQRLLHLATRVSAESAAVSDSATHLIETLSGNGWAVSSSWTPTSSRDEWRWQFQFDPQALQAHATDPSSLPSELTESEADPNLSPVLPTSPQTLPASWVAELPQLAMRLDDVGRNACVLWCQQDPLAAFVVHQRLEGWVSGEQGSKSAFLGFSSWRPQNSDSKPPSDAFRSAAAEAWCRILGTQPGDPVDNLAPVARLLKDRSDLPVLVRLELWRGLSYFVPPVAVTEINEGLLRESGGRPVRPEVRHAALEACLIYASAHTDQMDWSSPLWPENLLDWADRGPHTVEEDPRLRAHFGTWLALTRHPQAAEVLKSQLTDTELSVRQTAMQNLGQLQTPAALDHLQQQAKRTEPTVRAEAVRGLSRWGVRAIADFVGDSSLEVRIAVAESLAAFPDLQAANLLWRLQTDSSRDVQRAVLVAVRDWPDSLAIPILLHGLERGTTTTRRRCYTELAARTKLTEPFPFFGSAAERADAVQSLASRNGLSLRLAGPTQAAPVETPSDWQRIDDLHADLKLVTDPDINPRSVEYQDAFDRLRRAQPADISAMEAFLVACDPNSPGAVRLEHDVLPAVSPVYAALMTLQQDNLEARRGAARDLADWGAKLSLSPFVVRRLGEHLAEETDELVWRSALQAVWRDSHPQVDRIIRLAAHQEVTGLRQRACEYASAHPRPAHGEWLPLLLKDEQLAVRLAAIDAAGRCRNRRVLDGVRHADSTQPNGLRPLLTDPQETVRVAAAIAMSRHGDPQGLDELIRLSWHADGRIRRQVVEAMGESGQARFIEHLIRLGWTDRDITVRRAVLDSLDELVPPETRPTELARMRTTDDRMTAWQTWRFASSPASANTDGAVPNQFGNRTDDRNP